MENINSSNGLQKFIDIYMKTLDKFAPRKKKYSQGNNMPFMNKSLSRAHMKRTRLRNCYLKKNALNRIDYLILNNVITYFSFNKNQKSLLRKLTPDIVDNEKFWRTVKHLFSDKTKSN